MVLKHEYEVMLKAVQIFLYLIMDSCAVVDRSLEDREQGPTKPCQNTHVF